ncbi:MAG: serine/threonine protein kinase [Nannocystaceae bacterium]|nr:serine/threonine protein kinase [Nannocystaceae bacterium]
MDPAPSHDDSQTTLTGPNASSPGGRWRRLQAFVNARVFGDAPPMLGRYRLLDAIGSGAMGVVLRALDTELEREVALKLLGAEGTGGERHRLQREAQAMARVSHPNVVAVYDVGEHDGELFLAMELVRGRTLRAWLEERPRTWREIAAVFAAAARGLAAAHDAGLVHRDFKPENVLVDERGRVCVVDFGLVTRGTTRNQPLLEADAMPHDVTSSIPLAGTPAYMAPEQVQGRPVDARADVWSLCVALFEALYGRRPFDGATVVETLTAVVRGHVRWPSPGGAVPARLRRLLRRGLQADRDQRELDCERVARELEASLTARRRFAVIAGASAMTAAFAALGVRAFAPHTADCDEQAHAALGDAWGEPRRDAIAAQLAGLDGPGAAHAGERLAAHAASWRTTYARSCTATEADGDATEAAAVALCLQQDRDGFVAIGDLLAEGDPAVLGNVALLLTGLREPARCLEPGARALAPESDIRAPELRSALARARALWSSGDDERAEALAREVIDRARAQGQDPAWVHATVLLGEITSLRLDDVVPAVPLLQQARAAAMAAGQQAALARLDALLVIDPTDVVERLLQRRFAAALALADAAGDAEALALLAIATWRYGHAAFGLSAQEVDALRERVVPLARQQLGEGHRLVRTLADARGLLRHDVDVLQARQLVANTQAQWGPDSRATADARFVLAGALWRMDQLEPALAEQDAAMAIVERASGQRSVTYAMALVQRFEMQAERGAIAGALADADRAIALLPLLPDNPLQYGRPTAASVAADAAQLLLRHGQSERARSYAERAAADEDRDRRLPGQLALAEVRLHAGELAEVERDAAAMLAVLDEPEPKLLPVSTMRARVRLVRGEALLARGALADAQEDFLAAGRDVLSSQPRDQARVQLGLGRVALAQRDPDDVALALQRAQPLLEHLGADDPVRLGLETLATQAPRP